MLLNALFLILAAWVIAPASAKASQEADESQIANAIRRIENNEVGNGPVDALSLVNIVASGKTVQSLPVLRQYFSRTPDAEIKAGVASALVRMGDRSDVYWNYLVTLATVAVNSDAPDPFGESMDRGKAGPSANFLAWASAHNLSTDSAFELAAFSLPAKLAPLAKTGDPRGVPLLRKALRSPNLLIASLAVAGLAQAHDTASVPMIIAACNTLPFDSARRLAEALMFFDDAVAQKTFVFYSPSINAEKARNFNGNSPFGPAFKTER